MEERGKSITACFNTWNACDFEVDKGRQSSRGDAFDCFSRGSRRWVIDVSVIGHEVIGGCVCALCSARMKPGIAVFRCFYFFFSRFPLDSRGLIGSPWLAAKI